jgi:hypothetical protein
MKIFIAQSAFRQGLSCARPAVPARRTYPHPDPLVALASEARPPQALFRLLVSKGKVETGHCNSGPYRDQDLPDCVDIATDATNRAIPGVFHAVLVMR